MEWKQRGVDENVEFAILTNEISKATFGKTVDEYKQFKGLQKHNLRDHMNDLELIFTMLGEKVTTEITRQRLIYLFSLSYRMVEDELLWLTEKRQDLVEKHRGQWVVIDPKHNKVFASDNLHEAVVAFEKEHPGEIPSFFKIPTKEEELCAYGISI